MIELSAPWPPSLNRLWRVFGKRIILSKAARAYKKRFPQHLPVGRVGPPLTGRLQVWLVMHPPQSLAASGQVWDICNREKLLCDCMTAQKVWKDDSQIDAMIILRGEPCKGGRVDVTIYPADRGFPL